MNYSYEKFYINLNFFDCISASGKDVYKFLQAQSSQDLVNIKSNFILSTCLDRQARIQAFYYVFSIGEQIKILCPSEFTQILLNHLNKYIIMEDTFFELSSHNYKFVTDKIESCPIGFFLSHEGSLTENLSEDIAEITTEALEELYLNCAYLERIESSKSKELLTSSTLFELAYSSTKGCFLGNETVSKIAGNKGASLYPCFIERNGVISIEMLKREDRIEGKVLAQGTVRLYPYFKPLSFKERARDLFLKGVNKINTGSPEEANKLLLEALHYDPASTDVVESLGVLEGKLLNFDKGIEYMDKLLQLNPDSIMAHTNKSLFLMKLGKIAEAEEEKAKASLKSFKSNATEDKQKEIEALDKKAKMFEKVLQIDSSDEYATISLAEIKYKLEAYSQCIELLKNILKCNEKLPKAYLLLGQSLLKTSNKIEAKDYFLKGVEVSSKMGQLKLANEMQELSII